jgi:hypothetical protein
MGYYLSTVRGYRVGSTYRVITWDPYGALAYRRPLLRAL